MEAAEFAEIFNLTSEQQAKFKRYFELLIQENEKVNLTAITAEPEVYLKHFYDSCAPVLLDLLENKPNKILDIGAGAGFPSLPMKIIFPELQITIIDSLAKRINFLTKLTSELALTNVTLLHGRAEDFGQDSDYREQFDFVLARAVARLNILSELTLPFLKVGGKLISYKSAQYQEEENEAANALILLGGKMVEGLEYQLPNGDPRHLTIVEKIALTDKKYPRRAGLPNKKPL